MSTALDAGEFVHPISPSVPPQKFVSEFLGQAGHQSIESSVMIPKFGYELRNHHTSPVMPDEPFGPSRRLPLRSSVKQGPGNPVGRRLALDVNLLDRTARGDTEAFRELYRQMQRPLFAFLFRLLGVRAIADELVNEVMFEVWRGAASFEGRASPESWIFGIAYHRAMSALRQRTEEPLPADAAERFADPAPGAVELVERADAARLLGRLMDELTPEHRTVLMLTYQQGLSIREIAQAMDCPLNTVKTRMHYARHRLLQLLREAGIEGADL
ncbi:MAG: sigma-70 family RNA polymerase sigma factor [Proteobacteria bacterium]|nr:sigma-70 family RNA polymerase sigma factor [Pseudomonadota bacterium]